jgi:hypothetical protein
MLLKVDLRLGVTATVKTSVLVVGASSPVDVRYTKSAIRYPSRPDHHVAALAHRFPFRFG